jgi:hypothetical protein
MVGGILIIIVSGILSFVLIDWMKKQYPIVDALLLKNAFLYHVLLTLAYYGYVSFNPSDSAYYYAKVIHDFRGDTWMDFYGTSTTFIEFIAYPFIKYMAFSYEAVMALFSFFGFIGFIFFYVFFRENLRFKHDFLGYDLLTLIFFLPNLHFWSASLGKGAVIFMGLGMFFFGLSNFKTRFIPLFIGGIIIYHVRPHIMLVVLVSTLIGFIFSTKGVNLASKLVFLAAATVSFFFIYQDVLTLVGIDEEQIISQTFDLSHRASELGKATSGIDISSYSLPMQIFTFLYRPLFVDAPGILGIIVSFENVFYLLLTLRFLSTIKGWKFLFKGTALTKSSFLSFFTITIALAQISGNLGLAMRQKSQIMILLIFVIISFMDEQKYTNWLESKSRLVTGLKRRGLKMQG